MIVGDSRENYSDASNSSLDLLGPPAGMFWFKTVVACIGRLGITMAFEMVVFVNTELYPTFVRLGQKKKTLKFFVLSMF